MIKNEKDFTMLSVPSFQSICFCWNIQELYLVCLCKAVPFRMNYCFLDTIYSLDSFYLPNLNSIFQA